MKFPTAVSNSLWDANEIKPDRFCFLKLHGSVGWWARKCASPSNEKWRDYCPTSPDIPTDLLQLEKWLAQNNGIYQWEPLIAFPHEKKESTSAHPWDLVQSPYIAEIWKHAAAVLGEATDVTVIGYSFAEIDRAHMIENLLRKVSKETSVTIENKDPEAAQLALAGAEIPGRLEFKERTF